MLQQTWARPFTMTEPLLAAAGGKCGTSASQVRDDPAVFLLQLRVAAETRENLW
jgi:hypothetical protein